MGQFSGVVVKDQDGHPKEFSEAAATGIINVITDPPVEKVQMDTGKYYVIFK